MCIFFVSPKKKKKVGIFLLENKNGQKKIGGDG
jgi:hypothetical protein